jgi:predicted metal-dependent enzyme (double-stranded beta helix superfamily)
MPTKLDEMIRMLDEAVEQQAVHGCCRAVKDALEKIVLSGEDFVPEEYLRPADDKYARRLLHLDPKERYSLLVMVWDKGQGTSLHDHAGMWCVECVYRGRIQVTSFSCTGIREGLHQFTPETSLYAGPGEAGALIPPFDHHIIENPDEIPAVTLHVYGGEMRWCDAFEPVEGGYRMVKRELAYTP